MLQKWNVCSHKWRERERERSCKKKLVYKPDLETRINCCVKKILHAHYRLEKEMILRDEVGCCTPGVSRMKYR